MVGHRLLALVISFQLIVGCLLCQVTCGQDLQPGNSIAELIGIVKQQNARLNQQANEIRELRELIDIQPQYSQSPYDIGPGCGAASSTCCVPVVAELANDPSCSAGSRIGCFSLNYCSDYDGGFLAVRPTSTLAPPFELKINGWIQFRHHAFSRTQDSWMDQPGYIRPIRNRNAFDIERGRLIFSGYAQDPRLTYFLQLDGDTDGAHAVDFLDYSWTWEFSRQFRMQVGQRKVPAVRQWQSDSRHTRFSDRPMACEFFRPNRTVGLFAVGELGETGHYEVMLGNGYNTTPFSNRAYDDRLTFAATSYIDPWGHFGETIVDYDYSCNPLVRIGHSFAYSPEAQRRNAYMNLADGTNTTTSSALAPGVTLQDYDLFFYGVDAAWKYRGWSFNSEAFFRWMEELRANGPLPVNNVFQTGLYVEGGRFLIPKRLDVNARYSLVSDRYGEATEYAAGANWYPRNKPTMKLSFDVTYVNGSPVQLAQQDDRTLDLMTGDTGVLFRTQFQTEF